MTDTTNAAGDIGHNRWLRNEQIRKYCRDNDKILFDFADLETSSCDGSQQNTYYHAGSGKNIPYWHDDWRSEPYYNDEHINEAACTMKAKAMWWLLAMLAGWDPDCDFAADFYGNPTIGSEHLEVTFTDASTGDIDSWLWKFGNGHTDMMQNPIHIYRQPGNFTVHLKFQGRIVRTL
jgi:PKD domain-containing protein